MTGVLIDQALSDSDWDLLDPRRIRFESSGRDGRADYILSGKNGPLSVLEAKRPDEDPYNAKDQARGYAENVRAPFIILSNGCEHWFWNYQRSDQRDAYRIGGRWFCILPGRGTACRRSAVAGRARFGSTRVGSAGSRQPHTRSPAAPPFFVACVKP